MGDVKSAIRLSISTSMQIKIIPARVSDFAIAQPGLRVPLTGILIIILYVNTLFQTACFSTAASWLVSLDQMIYVLGSAPSILLMIGLNIGSACMPAFSSRVFAILFSGFGRLGQLHPKHADVYGAVGMVYIYTFSLAQTSFCWYSSTPWRFGPRRLVRGFSVGLSGGGTRLSVFSTLQWNALVAFTCYYFSCIPLV